MNWIIFRAHGLVHATFHSCLRDDSTALPEVRYHTAPVHSPRAAIPGKRRYDACPVFAGHSRAMPPSNQGSQQSRFEL